MTARHAVRLAGLATLVVLATLLPVTEALAQIAEDNLPSGPIDAFRQAALAAQGRIAGALTTTFWSLALIELTFTLVVLALHEASMEAFAKELVLRVLFIGFFWTLVLNGAGWVNAIVATFADLGSQAGGIAQGGLSPDDIVDTAVEMMKLATFEFSVTEFGTSLALLFASGICFIAMLIMAGNLALVLVEFYIVGYGGIVLLGLGGSRWTSNYAVAYLKYAVSIGMRIFIFYLLTGIGYAIIRTQVESQLEINLGQFWSLAGFAVVLCIVSSRAPDAVTGLLNGVSTSASISAIQAARVAGTVASGGTAAAASAAGGAMAAAQAARLGSLQPGNTAVNAAANLARAGGAEVRAKLTGRPTGGSVFPGGGTAGGRMASSLSSQAGKLAARSGDGAAPPPASAANAPAPAAPSSASGDRGGSS